MDNYYLPYEAKVVSTFIETEDKKIKTIELEFTREEDLKKFKYMPGQFAEFSLYSYGESPFGMASSPLEGNTIKFSVNRVGKVTTKISQLEIGATVGIRGPLGNWYPIEDFKGKNLVIIGGGFAFTTLRSLIEYVLHSKNRKDYKRLIVIYGARTPGMLLYRDELEKWKKNKDIELFLTVDNGDDTWKERVGLIPDVVGEVNPPLKDTKVVVCGPPIMIKFTVMKLKELKFAPKDVYTSLEMRMKCGIGKCGRCNIGPEYVCKDGPVFSLEQLDRLPMEY